MIVERYTIINYEGYHWNDVLNRWIRPFKSGKETTFTGYTTHDEALAVLKEKIDTFPYGIAEIRKMYIRMN